MIEEKQLSQARENSTNAVSIYSPPSNITTIIRCIKVTNTSGSPVDLRLFLDDDGTTYDESTALEWDKGVPAGSTYENNSYIVMNNSSGNLAYRSSVANALTITVFGAEIV
jgi:hypothetical protein